MTDTEDGLAAVAAAFGGELRGPAGWLWNNYPTLSAAKARGGRISWIDVTRRMNELGVRTVWGRKLKPETVRAAWNRVEREVKRRGGWAAVGPVSLPQSRPKPPVRRRPSEFPAGVRLIQPAVPEPGTTPKPTWLD